MDQKKQTDPVYKTLKTRWREVYEIKSEFAKVFTELSQETDGTIKNTLVQIAAWFNGNAEFEELLERPEILAACGSVLKSDEGTIESTLAEQSARAGFFQIVNNTLARPQIMKLLPLRLTLLIAAGTLLILFSIFIAPEFHDILRDFGMQLPTLTLAVFAVTDLISAIWWLLPAAVIGFPMGNLIWCHSATGKKSMSSNWVDHQLKNSRGDLGDWCWHTAMLLELGLSPDFAYQTAGKSAAKSWISRWSVRLPKYLKSDALAFEKEWLLNDPYDLVNQAILTPTRQGKIVLFHEISNYYWARSRTTSQWWIQLIFNILFWLLGLITLLMLLAIGLPLVGLLNFFV
jgi:hypothetical protein